MRPSILFLLSIFSVLSARSQLCTGSLGDPVALITFGGGSNPAGPELAPGKTNYNFVSNSCPNDGSYTITNQTSACFNNSWLTLTNDHTLNDLNGYFMLVNASVAPGVFYVDTVKGLCSGTTYEFSVYILNIIKGSACNFSPNKPNLTFTIELLDGTILTTYMTGDIPIQDAPTWGKYGTFLATPPGVTSVVIRIRNNAPGGCGNDLALDDIAFRPCGPKATVGIGGATVTDTALCEPDSRVFTLQASYGTGFTDPRVQWQKSDDNGVSWQDIPGATSNTYLRQPTGRGVYKYRYLIAEGNNIFLTLCRSASDDITFNVLPPPVVTIPANTSGCEKTTVTLQASGMAKYDWTGPNGFSSNLQNPQIKNVQYRDTGVYTVKGTTAEGCITFGNTRLAVLQSPILSTNSPQEVCEGKLVQLLASGGVRYKWSPANSLSNDTIPNPVAGPRDTTRYGITILNAIGCPDTGTVVVNVLRLPKANAGPDILMIKGNPVTLQSSVTGSKVLFRWTPTTGMVNPDAIRPTVNPPDDQVYRLDVTSACGAGSDEVKVLVFNGILVPNTFTPNGDGYNDVWEIKLLTLFPDCTVEVYNSAGQLVYRSIGYSKPWDGTRNGARLPAGTYYYAIDTKSVNLKRLTGYVTILR